MRCSVAVIAAFSLFASTNSVSAAPTQDPAVFQDEVEAVIVTGRRSGAPTWTVTRGGSTLILVGGIRDLPRSIEWNADALEAATARADLVLTPVEGRLSLPDLFRVIWRIRSIGLMPEGETSADYLPAADQARLEALMAGERNDRWRTQSLLLTAINLMQEKAGLGDGARDPVTEAVKRSARRARLRTRPVGTVRGDEMVESLISAPQTAHVACAQAAIAAAEDGPAGAERRAQAWRRFRVAEMIASPMDRALDACWPWGDPTIAPQMHGQWETAIEEALAAERITLAVAPTRLLAAPGGVLDRLEARGFEIEGPDWKAATP